MDKRVNILVDFGGPRSQNEIKSFLTALLCDQDVVRTNLWPLIHRFLFKKIAKKRAKKIERDYACIGGKSPIYENTENLKHLLQGELQGEVLAFHRYLPETHQAFIEKMNTLSDHEIRVVPLFPQFTYATTGSCARFFANHLPQRLVQRMRWVKSYPTHPHFISAWLRQIKAYLTPNAFLLFSFHGVPEKFIQSGDIYLDECLASYKAIMEHFPNHRSAYAFQSQFGPDIWLKPSTQEVCEQIEKYANPESKVILIPLSFTSDHIETLFEIKETYIPILEANHYEAVMVPSLNLEPHWVDTLKTLFNSKEWVNNQMLIRPAGCSSRCGSCKKRCRN